MTTFSPMKLPTRFASCHGTPISQASGASTQPNSVCSDSSTGRPAFADSHALIDVPLAPRMRAEPLDRRVDQRDQRDEGEQHRADVEREAQAIARAGRGGVDDVRGRLLDFELDRAARQRLLRFRARGSSRASASPAPPSRWRSAGAWRRTASAPDRRRRAGRRTRPSPSRRCAPCRRS